MNDLTTLSKYGENGVSGNGATLPLDAIKQTGEWTRAAIEKTPAFDMHTHLFAPEFGDLNLYGADELINYHYLIAEAVRAARSAPQDFFALATTRERADFIWRTLFVERTPVSEATRGVVKVFSALGLDPHRENLNEAREFFSGVSARDYVNQVFKIANVSDAVMTNDPFDERETNVWRRIERGEIEIDRRFHAALRLDPLLNDWRNAAPLVARQGFDCSVELNEKTYRAVREFLNGWIRLMKPLYLAVSLPDDFQYPEDSPRGLLIENAVLPVCREHDTPLSLMIGVRRGVNPELRLAGDGVGRADVSALARICAAHPEIRFLTSLLSLENQHELTVTARKFPNLMPFGCWWFLNNPLIIRRMTFERIEMLGATFVAQHSDARVLDQLIYKWAHSRRVIGDVLTESYENLIGDGWRLTENQIERDVSGLFRDNFTNWTRVSSEAATATAKLGEKAARASNKAESNL